jgi:3-phosphoshikimate 1-carboxyvinyltransferase
MVITGSERLAGGHVSSQGDHRIAMSLAVAALRAEGAINVDDTACTATSFPNFWDLLDSVRG